MLYGVPNSGQRSVQKDFEMVAALGFDYIELNMESPVASHSILRANREVVLASLRDCGLQIVCHLPGFLISADQVPPVKESAVIAILESLEVAASLGALKAVMHPGFVTGLGTFERDRARRLVIEGLPVFVERADDLGLCLCIENMWPRANSLVDPEDFAEVFERFPSLKLCLDTGHANIGGFGPRNALEFIRKFPDRLRHVHASDNTGKSDDHLPLGLGSVDFPAIVRALKDIPYDDTVTFEINSSSSDELKLSSDRFEAMVRASVTPV